eukprot:m.102289 g.102289  ORF g.102289 m.102289 type:complete len:315 (-) comp22333_c0_seq1:141-1085(-)
MFTVSSLCSSCNTFFGHCSLLFHFNLSFSLSFSMMLFFLLLFVEVSPFTPPSLIPPVLPTVTEPLVVANPNVSALPVYDRSDWPHWRTISCINTRNAVLAAESLTSPVFSDGGCKVASGNWTDVYSNTTGITDPSDLDVDHMVPLKNAHDSGGYQWDREKKRDYANDLSDPDHLIAVTQASNRGKAASGPEAWMPSDQSYWCTYIVLWVQIKHRWNLTATTAEWEAVKSTLSACSITLTTDLTTTTTSEPETGTSTVALGESNSSSSSSLSTGAIAGISAGIGGLLIIVVLVLVLTRHQRRPIVPQRGENSFGF